MAKKRTSWICQQCGAVSPAFLGRCPGCGEWNTMVETLDARPEKSARAKVARIEGESRLTPLNQI